MKEIQRMPNECEWLLSYKGRDVSGLRILIYIVTSVDNFIHDKTTDLFEIKYSRIRRNIPQLKNKTCVFLHDCVKSALSYADGYVDDIADVRIYENGLHIRYTDGFAELVSKRISGNYFMFMFDDILKLPTINSIKMYILYRKYYKIITYMKFRDSDIMEIFGINVNLRKNMYRAIRSANDHLNRIGIRSRLERFGNVWRFVSA